MVKYVGTPLIWFCAHTLQSFNRWFKSIASSSTMWSQHATFIKFVFLLSKNFSRISLVLVSLVTITSSSNLTILPFSKLFTNRDSIKFNYFLVNFDWICSAERKNSLKWREKREK